MKKELISDIEHAILVMKEYVDNESMEEVNHFFEHGEYEMAFEGLMIELMNTESALLPIKFNELKEIAIQLNLDNESVFDGEFWEKFMKWGKGEDIN